MMKDGRILTLLTLVNFGILGVSVVSPDTDR